MSVGSEQTKFIQVAVTTTHFKVVCLDENQKPIEDEVHWLATGDEEKLVITMKNGEWT